MKARALLVPLVLVVGATLGSGASLAAAGGPTLFVFNMGSDDVTLIDPTRNTVLGTRPVGFKVKWLADAMRSFDGTLLWTYGLRTERVGRQEVVNVDVIAFDPAALRVVRRQPLGRGPAHSVGLTPDGKHVLVNVAGDDVIAYVDTASAQVTHRVPVGRFPCDLHLAPDGRWAYVPERDQDTVSVLDVAGRQVARRVSFAPGSRPHMLRVSPDGRYLWVQTAGAHTNEILLRDTLEVVNVQPVGRVPSTNAWTPDGRFSWVLHEGDNHVIVMEAGPPFRQVKRIEVGPDVRNVAFRPDGRYAYVTVAGLNAVAVVDVAELRVDTMLPAGRGPSGLVLLEVRPRW
jgi:YVTN family beta-propeller protein